MLGPAPVDDLLNHEPVPVALDDGTVRTVLDVGSGPPLLLVQGMAATHAHWGEAFLRGLLAAGRRIISINHIGVAGSSRIRESFTIADLADAQLAILFRLGNDEPVVVYGITMG
ncbi:MAG: alpha/beta fold hydrolase, partial [Solirubrobacteraceae bacterium]